MSALSGAAAAIGSGFLSSLGQALVSWWALAIPGVLLMLGARWYLRRRTLVIRLVRLAPARDDTQPWPAPRAPCPWCDTHACIDRTLCNCKEACGSWLCTAKEASK